MNRKESIIHVTVTGLQPGTAQSPSSCEPTSPGMADEYFSRFYGSPEQRNSVLLKTNRVVTKRSFLSVFCLTTLIQFMSHLVSAQTSDYIVYSAEGVPGRLYVPRAARGGVIRPFILALHGGGGIGSDNSNHLVDFNNLLTEAKQRGAFLYVPQATTARWYLADRRETIMAMIDKAIDELNADPEQIYITGFSMGGGGVWDFVNLHPERFAAAVPIAGVVPRSNVDYSNLAGVPTWAFHARNDSVVSVQNSRNEITAILNETGEPVPSYLSVNDRTTTSEFVNESPDLSYTEWPTGDHFIWNRVYSTEAMYDWLFARTLKNRPTANLDISNPSFDPGENLFSFDVTTDPIVDVDIEFSSALIAWTHLQTLTNVTGTVSFQTNMALFPDSTFFRILQTQ